MAAAEALDVELEPFRAEAREWLAENFPPSLANVDIALAASIGVFPSTEGEKWVERMGTKGWGTPTWPKKYGGGGLSPAEARVLGEEMARIGARNPIQGMGPGMFGHTL